MVVVGRKFQYNQLLLIIYTISAQIDFELGIIHFFYNITEANLHVNNNICISIFVFESKLVVC